MSALVNWINTFAPLPKECENLSDLSDGIIAQAVLRKISPETDLSTLSTEGTENSVLRVANIKKVLNDIHNFYRNVLKLHADVEKVDASALGRNGDVSSAESLAVLLLGCAIQCEKKNDYIGTIMTLDQASQASLVPLIQQIMSNVQPTSPDNKNHPDSDEEFTLVSADDLSHSSKIRSLEQDLKEKEAEIDEKNTLIAQLKRENETLQHDLSLSMEEKHSLSLKINAQVKGGISDTQKHSSLEIEEMEIRLSQLEEESEKKRAKMQMEIDKLAAANRSLQDELDVTRHKAEQAQALEQKLSILKGKLEQSKHDKDRIAQLEETNAEYLDQNLDLEDQIKKLENVKEQLEAYKDKFAATEADKIKLRNSISAMEEENTRIRAELNEHQSEIRTLKSLLRSSSNAPPESVGEIGIEEPSLADSLVKSSSSTAELMKKIARLERENKKLLESKKENEVDVDVDVDKTKTEDADRVVKLLEKENKDLSAKISIQAQKAEGLERMLREQEEAASGFELKYKQAMEELSRRKGGADEGVLKQLEDENRRLKGRLAALQAESQKGIDTKQTEFETSTASLQKQLAEKSEQVEDYARKMRKALSASEREQRLITGWIYDLEMELQRTKMTQRATMEAHSSKSWLSRRRAEILKEVTVNTHSPHTSSSQPKK